MRRIEGMVAGGALVVGLMVSGCGGGGSSSATGGGSSGSFCSALRSASQKLTSSEEASLSKGGSSASSVVGPELKLFKSLAASAPSSLKGNLDNLASALSSIQTGAAQEQRDVSNPSKLEADTAAEEKAVAKLPSDETALEGYVAKHCT